MKDRLDSIVMVAIQSVCPPSLTELFGNVCRHFFIVTTKDGGATDIWWVEARDATKHSAMHRIACPIPGLTHIHIYRTKNYPAPNVNGVKVEKPCSRMTLVFLISKFSRCWYYLSKQGQMNKDHNSWGK